MNDGIRENIEIVRRNIRNACQKSGRDEETVQLIAVSKTKPMEDLQKAYECGCRDFGENKVQELVEKYEKLPKDIRWHMIGHLQRNKVKYIVDKVFLIHSVDSIRLAEEISKEALKKHVTVSVLVEVNVANEESKFGTIDQDALHLVEEIAKLPGICVKGLMTIAPFVDNPEDNRIYFRRLRNLAVDIGENKSDNVTMSVLSMGMTGDFEVAVEEGATMIRVGTGIFGSR